MCNQSRSRINFYTADLGSRTRSGIVTRHFLLLALQAFARLGG